MEGLHPGVNVTLCPLEVGLGIKEREGGERGGRREEKGGGGEGREKMYIYMYNAKMSCSFSIYQGMQLLL